MHLPSASAIEASRPSTGRHTLDMGIPMYAHTDNPDQVAQMVERLLADISAYDGAASHADILQALDIAAMVRFAMSEVAARSGTECSVHVLGVEPLAYAA